MSLRDTILAAKRQAAAEAASAKFDETNKDTTSAPRAALEGLKQGASLGFSDEIEGATGALYGLVAPDVGVDPSLQEGFVDTYRRERDAARDLSRRSELEHQGAHLAGNLAGTAATSALGGAAASPVLGRIGLKGASMVLPQAAIRAGETALQGAAFGGAQGAIQGLGVAEGGVGDQALETLKGGAMGAVMGGALGGLTGARGASAPRPPKPQVNRLGDLLASPRAQGVAKTAGGSVGAALGGAVASPFGQTPAGVLAGGYLGKQVGPKVLGSLQRRFPPTPAAAPAVESTWAQGPQSFSMPKPGPMSSPDTPGGARPMPQPPEVPAGAPKAPDGRALPAGRGSSFERLARERGVPAEEPSVMQSLDFGDETPAWRDSGRPVPDLGEAQPGFTTAGREALAETVQRPSPYEPRDPQPVKTDYRKWAEEKHAKNAAYEDVVRRAAEPPASPQPGVDMLLAQAMETVPPAQRGQFQAAARSLPPDMLEQFLRTQLEARSMDARMRALAESQGTSRPRGVQ